MRGGVGRDQDPVVRRGLRARRARRASRSGSRPSRTAYRRGWRHPTRPAPGTSSTPTTDPSARSGAPAARWSTPSPHRRRARAAGLHVEQPQHRLDRARLGVRLPVPDLDRAVEAGPAPVRRGQEAPRVAPRRGRRRRHPWAPLNHPSGRPANGAVCGDGCGFVDMPETRGQPSRNTAPRQLPHVLPSARVADRTPGSTGAARHTVRRGGPEHPGPADFSRPRSGHRRAGDQRARGLDRGGGRRAREWCRRGRGERRTLHHSRPDRPADALAHRGARRGQPTRRCCPPCSRSCSGRTRRSGARPSTRAPRRWARWRSPSADSRRRRPPPRWSTTRRRAASWPGSGATCVGVAAFALTEGRELTIEVAPAWRRLGIGTQLLTRAASQAAAAGARRDRAARPGRRTRASSRWCAAPASAPGSR